MLEAAGFSAIGTTKSGIAFYAGLPEFEGVLGIDASLEETARIARAVRVPVSVDGENGYGHTPDDVAHSITRMANTGAVGASIEDFGTDYGTGELYEREFSIERIGAAKSAAEGLEFPFTLTARAECYLYDHQILSRNR